AGILCKKPFESILKRATGGVHVHMSSSAGHGPQWPRYPKTDSHRRLLFCPTGRVPFRLPTLTFSFLGDGRLRFSVGPGVGGPPSSATTALATQTTCGRPSSNSFQVLPASLVAYSLPLRVPK